MKKIFNRKKWEEIQRRKAERHEAYRAWAEKLDHARLVYGRKMAMFAGNFHDCKQAISVIEQDSKTLIADEIDAKIERMVHDWPGECEELNLSAGFLGKSHLLEVYKAMLEQKKLNEARDLAAAAQQSFVASFNVLNEFAAQHGFADQSRFDPEPVNAQSWGA